MFVREWVDVQADAPNRWRIAGGGEFALHLDLCKPPFRRMLRHLFRNHRNFGAPAR